MIPFPSNERDQKALDSYFSFLKVLGIVVGEFWSVERFHMAQTSETVSGALVKGGMGAMATAATVYFAADAWEGFKAGRADEKQRRLRERGF